MLLSVDTKLTKEVMSNLISNAIKYTPEGGSISVELYMHSKTMWALRIKDTGCGIAPSDQNRIYEKFFRAENARKTAPDGTGLGMYVIREIVHALGGGISLNSELNRGTTFTCTFPL
jgi:signal transduction histidine kinase